MSAITGVEALAWINGHYGEGDTYPATLHPTWRLEYLEVAGQ